MHTRLRVLLLLLSFVFTPAFTEYIHAQEDVVPTTETAVVQVPATPPAPAAKPGFFSWTWLGICTVVAAVAFMVGKAGVKQDSEFSIFLLDRILASLPDTLEIEYEVVKLSASRVKFSVRVLSKQPDSTGKLTTTEQELAWHDLPDEIRADLIRTKSDKHIRSLKGKPHP